MLAKVREEQKDANQSRIDAVKAEYGELKDATDLLYVSFEEPKEDRKNITFNRNEYKAMLSRLEDKKQDLNKPKPFKDPEDTPRWKYEPPPEPKSIRKVVFDSAVEARRQADGSLRPLNEQELEERAEA